MVLGGGRGLKIITVILRQPPKKIDISLNNIRLTRSLNKVLVKGRIADLLLYTVCLNIELLCQFLKMLF